jgi:hypothetical protein
MCVVVVETPRGVRAAMTGRSEQRPSSVGIKTPP